MPPPEFNLPANTQNLSGGLTVTGNGSLTLNGANSYGGPTTISSGTLVLGGVNGPGSNLPTTTARPSPPAACSTWVGNPQTVGSLSGSAGAFVANNFGAYTSVLTVSPTFRLDNHFCRQHR